LPLTLLFAASLTSCAAHSFPLTNQFINPTKTACEATTPSPCQTADRVEVFADVNGTLFPSGWRAFVHPRMSAKRPGEGRWRAGNLLAQSANNRRFRRLIEGDQTRQLAQLRDFAASHQRIFILIHGFNSSVAEAEEPFAAIETALELKPGDGVIRFYWDGLIGKGVGAIRIWLNAANASQLVGSNALRPILNQIEHKSVYMIAHSRGASVALSAIGNPVYNSGFANKERARGRGWGKAYREILSPPPLQDNGNSIDLLLLAPAIDRIDFCDASEQPKRSKGFVCTKFRSLGDQVKRIAYTVNSGDPVLGKFLLSPRALIATSFGYQVDVGRLLKAEQYPILREYEFVKPEAFHDFKLYLANPIFSQMLIDAGIRR